MENINFKNAMKAHKDQKNSMQANKNDNKKFIKYSDVIKEKIKENKTEKSILRNFEEIEKEQEQWFKLRNEQLNKEKEKINDVDEINKKHNEKDTGKKQSDNTGNVDKDILNEDIISVNANSEENYASDTSEKAGIKITVDPKEVIQEINEHGDVERTIYADKYQSDYKCEELYNWFRLMFLEWEKELDAIPEPLKESPEGRQKFGIYKQCRGYIKPLLRILKHKQISKEIMNKLFEIMVFCLDKDYIRAHDKYIELAIGNAPWPMGVTMVGIHERSGRSRIATSQVAHILNDENTKKYLQSVKRIMSLVQRLNPTSPSNSVFS
jgi:pre-mRNA-splicing factor 18